MDTTVLEGQSLFDVGLQTYGSAEGAFTLALENNLSITDELTLGQVLNYSIKGMTNKAVVEYYRINGIKPATAITQESDPEYARIFEHEFEHEFE